MKVAAFQAPLQDAGTAAALSQIRQQIDRCETEGVRILICRDSNDPASATVMAAGGAAVLFVPSNNGMPPAKGGPELIGQARSADIARAVENRVWVVRADVAGQSGELVSHGSSGIVGPDGLVRAEAEQLRPGLVVADLEIGTS